MRTAWSWQASVVVLVVMVMLAAAGNRVLVWHDERRDVAQGNAAVAAATTEVERLVSISASTSGDDVARLLDGATAQFRSDLQHEADALRRALTVNKVTATGRVVSSALMKLDGSTATVLIAATGTVKNKQAGATAPRSYRLRVDLQQTGGRWLVSGLEFVT